MLCWPRLPSLCEPAAYRNPPMAGETSVSGSQVPSDCSVTSGQKYMSWCQNVASAPGGLNSTCS